MIDKIKKCCICGERPLSAFGIDRTRKDGFNNRCKDCNNAIDKEYRKKNKGRINLYNEKNKSRKNNYNKKYYKKHRNIAKAYMEKYREENKEYFQLYWHENKEELNKKRQERYRNDSKFRIRCLIGGAIRRTLKSGKDGQILEHLVGYSVMDLIKRLKATLPDGFTWENFLNGSDLHIDHIIPVSAFNFTKPEHEDFKRCWALKNLQLLSAKENIKKGMRLDRPFQPSLTGI